MTKKILLLLSSAALILSACKQAPADPAQTAAPAAAAAKAPVDGVERFGAPVSAGKSITVTDILKDPDAYVGKELIVEGTVKAVCKKKGCWMELAASADKNAPGCRITFKDYGFFVAKDSQGSAARVEGKVEVKTLSKSEIDHLEQEGATFANKLADGGAKQIALVATGVELKRAN